MQSLKKLMSALWYFKGRWTDQQGRLLWTPSVKPGVRKSFHFRALQHLNLYRFIHKPFRVCLPRYVHMMLFDSSETLRMISFNWVMAHKSLYMCKYKSNLISEDYGTCISITLCNSSLVHAYLDMCRLIQWNANGSFIVEIPILILIPMFTIKYTLKWVFLYLFHTNIKVNGILWH